MKKKCPKMLQDQSYVVRNVSPSMCLQIKEVKSITAEQEDAKSDSKVIKYKDEYVAAFSESMEIHKKTRHKGAEGHNSDLKDLHVVNDICCPNCPMTFSAEGPLVDHIKNMHIRGEFPCTMCNHVAIDQYECKRHKKSHTERCMLCSYKCFGRSRLEMHTKKMHNMNLAKFLDEQKSEQPETLQTANFDISIEPENEEHIGVSCVNDTNMTSYSEKRQVKIALTKKHKCELCPYMAKRKVYLRQHQYKTHKKFKDEGCPKCHKVFKYWSEFKYHMKKMHGRGSTSASRRIRREAPSLKKPKPKGNKMHTCEWCQYKTNNRTNMDRHKNAIHLNIPGKRLKSKPQSDTDTASEGEHSFQCELCKFTTHKSHNLRQHEYRVHKKTKDEQCPKCPRAFKFKSQLRYHFRDQHLKPSSGVGRKIKPKKPSSLSPKPESDKKYKCDMCSFGTKHRTALTHHLRSKHSKLTVMHKCNVCSFECEYIESMKNHMETVHGGMVGYLTTSSNKQKVLSLKETKPKVNKNLECDSCPYKTNSRWNMDRHKTAREFTLSHRAKNNCNADDSNMAEEKREGVIVGLNDLGLNEVELQYSVGREKPVKVTKPQSGACSNEDSDDDDLDEFIAVEGAEELPEAEIVTLS